MYKERESQALKEDANRLIRRIQALPIYESDASQAVTGIQFWVSETLDRLEAVTWADSAMPPTPVEQSVEDSIKKAKQQAKKDEEKLIEELEKQNA